MALYRDRTDAGQKLAQKLKEYKDRKDVLILALPRGGVPVAYEVANSLNAPLDIFLQALAQMSPETEKKIEIIPGATHLFEDPGTLEQVARRARDWLKEQLSSTRQSVRRAST